MLLTAQSGNNRNFVRNWVETLILDVAALALHSWLHFLQRMQASNTSQHNVDPCAWFSHQQLTLQEISHYEDQYQSSTFALEQHAWHLPRCWVHQG